MKKKLGILGMSQLASSWYREQLPEKIRQQSSYVASDFARLNELLPLPSEELLARLSEELEKVSTLTHLLVPNITIHHCLDILTERGKLETKLIHPLELLLDRLRDLQETELLIFGTVHTMKPSYISERLARAGISCYFPNELDIAFIDQFRRDVFQGIESAEQVKKYEQLLETYSNDKITVLCCTELSMKYAGNQNRVFDLARLQLAEFTRLFDGNL